MLYALRTVIDALQRFSQIVDEERCHGRRCLLTSAGYEVNDRLVAVVTYAGNYGQGEVCHVFCQQQGIEARQVSRASAATDYHHSIERPGVFKQTSVYHVKRSRYALLHLFALHHGRKQSRHEL